MKYDSDSYYDALRVLDRLEEVRERKGINKIYMATSLGYSPQYYYKILDFSQVIRLELLRKFSQVLDVSLEYILTGKNYSEYKDVTISYEKFLQLYDSRRYSVKIPNRMTASICNLRKGKTKNLSIPILFEFESLYKLKSIYPYIIK